MNLMTYGSLFSGVGGIDLGLDRAGMQCRWQVEIDEYARNILTKHWPEVPKYGDITKLSGDELERVDLICGGFPCQDLSQAGKRKGLVHEDGSITRSGLWFEFARLIGELRPRYILAENVPGLLVPHRNGERINPAAMSFVVGELARLGYVGSWLCLRAADFGASHLRKRVFIVAHNARDFGRRESLSLSGSAISTGDGAGGTDLADTRRELLHVQQSTEPDYICLGPFAPGPADGRWPAILREHPDLAPALESPIRGVASRISDRVDRAMSNRTKRLSRLGNSVVPQCAQYIGERILQLEAQYSPAIRGL